MPVEHPATIAMSGPLGEQGLALEGLFVGGDRGGGAVVAPPHPSYGGRMENPVVTEVALRLQQRGVSSLRFNWRGVGASAGTPSGQMDAAVEDYGAALSFLEESAEGPLLACGYSFGAAAAVLGGTACERIRRLVLISPPPSLLDVDRLRSFDGDVWIAVGEHDQLAPASDLEALTAKLERCSYECIPDSDHFFGGGTALLGRALERWLH